MNVQFVERIVERREEQLIPMSDGTFVEHAWMRMNEGQLRRSWPWLLEEIRLALKQKLGAELKVCGLSVRFIDFEGVQDFMWMYRCNCVGTNRTLKAQYLVCEAGRPHNFFLKGDVMFRFEGK